MNHVLYPDDSSAAPAHRSSADDGLPDFRRWLAAVQSGMRTEPGGGDVVPRVDDHSPHPRGESTEFPAQESDPGQTR